MTSFVAEPPKGGWVHEIRHDGYRTILTADGRPARAFTRNRLGCSSVYTPLVGAAAEASLCFGGRRRGGRGA